VAVQSIISNEPSNSQSDAAVAVCQEQVYQLTPMDPRDVASRPIDHHAERGR